MKKEAYPPPEDIYIKKNKVDNLPHGVTISTMCASAKRDKDTGLGGLGTDILLPNVYKYMKLSPNDILEIKKDSQTIYSMKLNPVSYY